MRGKLRDKREVKRDRLKREMLGRRPSKRDNRNLQVQPFNNDDDDDYALEEEDELAILDERQN